MSLEIVNTPMMVTIQDRGRFGYTHLGVTPSGAMDEYAYLMANRLLGNDPDASALEIYYGNITLIAHAQTQIVLTGALCEFTINGKALELWRSYVIHAGDVIRIGSVTSGTVNYLALRGGFEIKQELGSRSTTLREQIGGLEGRKLQKGDFLPFGNYSPVPGRALQQNGIPEYRDLLELRVMFSYQAEGFTKEEKIKFLSSTYHVSTHSNRMGYKLEGPAIAYEGKGLISEGITLGAIQIPQEGQPLVLLKERQSIGGYPKIGVVLDVDCFRLAQARPGNAIRFKEMSFEEGAVVSKKFYDSFWEKKAVQ